MAGNTNHCQIQRHLLYTLPFKTWPVADSQATKAHQGHWHVKSHYIRTKPWSPQLMSCDFASSPIHPTQGQDTKSTAAHSSDTGVGMLGVYCFTENRSTGRERGGQTLDYQSCSTCVEGADSATGSSNTLACVGTKQIHCSQEQVR